MARTTAAASSSTPVTGRISARSATTSFAGPTRAVTRGSVTSGEPVGDLVDVSVAEEPEGDVQVLRGTHFTPWSLGRSRSTSSGEHVVGRPDGDEQPGHVPGVASSGGDECRRRDARRTAWRRVRSWRGASSDVPGRSHRRRVSPVMFAAFHCRRTTGARIWSWWICEVVDAGLGDQRGVAAKSGMPGAGHREVADLLLDRDHHRRSGRPRSPPRRGRGRRGGAGSRRPPTRFMTS